MFPFFSIRCLVVAYGAFFAKTWSAGVLAGTKADVVRNLENGDAKVLLGAFLGEVSIIMKGIQEGGEVTALMDPIMGQTILKLGRVFVDFPIAPALHISFYQGDMKHVEAAFFLMNRGADVNSFVVERNSSEKYSPNYPPCIMYTIGMGKKPLNMHAALLQRLHASLPSHFRLDLLEKWRLLTGNPPIIQIAALANFFDGLYVFVTEFKSDVDAVDQNGLTALHIAAWKGDHFLGRFLIHHGANMMLKDNYGRTAFHYAAMRGNIEFMIYYLEPVRNRNLTVSEHLQTKQDILLAQDNLNLTAYDLSALNPPSTLSVDYLTSEFGSTGLPFKDENRARRLPRIVEFRTKNRSIPEQQSGDDSDTRGGWSYYSTGESVYSNPVGFLGIDMVSASTLTRQSFRKDYFSSQRPVLIYNHLTAKQDIWAYWQKEEFLKRYGSMEVSSGEKLHAVGDSWFLEKPKSWPLRDWVGRYMSHNMSLCHAVIEDGGIQTEVVLDSTLTSPLIPPAISLSNISEGSCVVNDDGICQAEQSLAPSSVVLRHSVDGAAHCTNQERSDWVAFNPKASLVSPFWNSDFQKPPIFQLCGTERTDNEPMKLVLGPRGSGVPMQAHSASWDLLVSGVKRWYLIPPGSGIQPLGPPNEHGNHKVKSVAEWIEDVLPDLVQRKLVSTVVQYPGDVVFVPHDWSYVTLLESDSISVSQEFCTLLNTDQRFQPLGFVIYGGSDPHRGIGRLKL